MSAIKNGLAVAGGVALFTSFLKGAANKIKNNIIATNGIPQIDLQEYVQGYLLLDMPVTITNHNPFSIGVDSFQGRVSYGALTLTDVALPYGFYIEAGKTQTFNLDINIPLQQVGNDLAALINNGNIFNALLNKLTLNGKVMILGNYTAIEIPLENIVIPIL